VTHAERGQVTVLALGLCLVVLAVGGIAIDGTRAFMFRRTLQNAADSASLAAAGAVDEGEFYASGGRQVRLEGTEVEAAAERLLIDRGVPARAVLRVAGEVVVLQLRGSVDATFLRLVGIDEIPVAVEARSAPIEGDPG
jgi:hypothetical protein